MENASKALVIAGGILLAILIISVMLYMYIAMGNASQREQDVSKAEELSAFNKQYESYNKSSMYGTDVITVLNKAIDNNKKYGNQSGYTIEISVTIIEDMYTTEYTYTFDDDTGKWNSTSKTISNDTNPILKKDTYTTSNSEDVEMIQCLLAQSGIQSNEKNYTSADKKSYITTETAFSVLKKRKFTCTGMQYDSNTGRVSSMSFKQI